MTQVLQGDILSLDPIALPASGSDGEVVLDQADNKFKRWDSVQDQWVLLATGGVSIPRNGYVHWSVDAGEAPIESSENGLPVYLFEPSITQKLVAAIRVPLFYDANSQIDMSNFAYSPSTTDEWRIQIVSTLIRDGIDPITSTTNQNIANSGDITNSVANQLRNFSIPLTDGSGQINGIPVSVNDLIIVELSRQAPGGVEDSENIRFLPGSTEVRF